MKYVDAQRLCLLWGAVLCPVWTGCHLSSADRSLGCHSPTAIVSRQEKAANALPAVILSESAEPEINPVSLDFENAESNWKEEACECNEICQNSCLPPVLWNDRYGKMFGRLGDDARGLANWNNAIVLGTALGGAIAIRQDLDEEVRANVIRHSERWGKVGDGLGNIGDGRIQFPVLLALYGYSLNREDQELREVSGTMLSAMTLTGIATLSIKAIANTDRPSPEWYGGQFGFPSSHASSSFAIAAVLDEFYGLRGGLPAYLLAGAISWSRIDERDHDLSDVVFGSALGFVIGKSVARKRLYGDSRVRLLPYVHPTDGSNGMMLDIPY